MPDVRHRRGGEKRIQKWCPVARVAVAASTPAMLEGGIAAAIIRRPLEHLPGLQQSSERRDSPVVAVSAAASPVSPTAWLRLREN